MSDTDEMVKGMAKLTVMSNRISEIQEKNLKMFPLIAFDDVKDVKISYDLHTDHDVDDRDKKKIVIKAPKFNHFVTYHLKIDSDKNTEHMKYRIESLEKWIKELFWSGITVKVHINDKLIETKDVK